MFSCYQLLFAGDSKFMKRFGEDGDAKEEHHQCCQARQYLHGCLLQSIYPFVDSQIRRVYKVFTTRFATEWPLTCMSSNMFIHTCLCFEGFATSYAG